jgi:hypothetical protein
MLSDGYVRRALALPAALGLAGGALALLFAALPLRPAEAAGVVTVCDQAHLETALAAAW